ncbi:MAG: hypothetical protein PWP05_1019 [Thermovirga sp.]|jgi:hypothetical protein|nr:hypothetical protein [Thermovirga sp.]MDN5368304.1 hypothetical protein [Thermovirga sp.]
MTLSFSQLRRVFMVSLKLEVSDKAKEVLTSQGGVGYVIEASIGGG